MRLRLRRRIGGADEGDETKEGKQDEQGADAAGLLAVEVRQDVSDDTFLGAVVWDCGVVLVKLLERLDAGFLGSASALELGSGTGFVGLCAARLGVRRCTLTDLPLGMPLLQENVLRNPMPPGSSVSTAVLRWGQDTAAGLDMALAGPSALAGEKHGHRLVLCSDVLYDDTAHEALRVTLAQLLAAPHTTVLLTVKLRSPTYVCYFPCVAVGGGEALTDRTAMRRTVYSKELAFLESMEALGHSILCVPSQDVHPDPNTKDVSVFLLARSQAQAQAQTTSALPTRTPLHASPSHS